MKILFLFLFLALALPVTGGAVLPTGFVPADSGFASNTVIDIIGHNGSVWLATGRGVNVSDDLGMSWLLFQDAPGMVSANVSSISSQGDRVWMATSHSEIISGANESISDGMFYSDDDGATWTQVNFGSDGLDIPWIWGGFQTIFDITGHQDIGQDERWLFFAAFAGGLVASRDDGINWRRIYPSEGDSVQYNDPFQQPSLRNRYFSAVVDTSHADTLMLWTGTAAGILQYVFAPNSEKLWANKILAVAGCDLCSDSTVDYLYVGTDLGVSRVLKSGGPFMTRTISDTSMVSALYDFRDHLFIGMVGSTGESVGLAVSTDYGESYSPVVLPEIIGADRIVSEFVSVGERLYLAAQAAGLFVTLDTGSTWQRILVDSVSQGSAINSIYALDVVGDTLFLGTDSGVVRFNLAPDGSIDSLMHFPYIEDVFSAAGIRSLAVHHFTDSLGAVDSVLLWTVNAPVSDEGVYSVTRGILADTLDINSISYPVLWKNDYMQDTISFDVGFLGDTVFVLGETGLWSNSIPGNENVSLRPSHSVNILDSVTGQIISGDTLFAFENIDGRAVFGTSSSLAIMRDSTFSFRIKRGNVDSLGADVVVNHTFLNTLNLNGTVLTPGLAGDFIPALAIQETSLGLSRVWASGRPTTNGFNGISVGVYGAALDTLGDSVGVKVNWQNLYSDDFAWNFAFDGDSVAFAATNSGLLVNRQLSSEWDTLSLETGSGVRILGPEDQVFGVAVIDDDLWIGTGQGTIRQNLRNDLDTDFFIVIDSTTSADEVYAYPVPFSPGRGEEVHFRFVLDKAADVTIEVYDFALNLVARPFDNVFLPAGYYESPDSERLTWNGLNGKGDVVAVGMYYFKVTYSTGGIRWGKLAVMP